MRKILFVQPTEPGAYPPLINVAHSLADAGWSATFLSAPIVGKTLRVPPHPSITVIGIPPRPTHIMHKLPYFRYCLSAASLARRLRPDWVYASDPIGAAPGALAAHLSGARLIYHEHDSPNSHSALHPLFRVGRNAAVAIADGVIFPNGCRLASANRELRFDLRKSHVVWNVPRKSEVPPPTERNRSRRPIIHYHGNISDITVPQTLLQAMRLTNARPVLRLVGYETQSGYIDQLISEFGNSTAGGFVEYVGPISRDALLGFAASSDIGVVLMPKLSTDINRKHMTGASVKAFDYMAAGLPLVVSNSDEWQDFFVKPGHALAADPASPESLASALRLLIEDPAMAFEMGRRNRNRILDDWNFEACSKGLMLRLQH